MAGYKKAGSGNPWVILHGLFSDMSDLVPLAEHLKEKAVWLFDLPGFGRSPYHHQENVMEGHIQSAVEAIRELPHPIHLVGHSFGGYLACEIAKREPEKIEKLYLLQPPPQAPKYPAFLKRSALLRKMLQMNVTTRRLESLLLEQGVFQTKEEIPPNYLEKVGGLLQSPRIMKSHMDVLAYFMGDFTNISDHLPTGIPAHVIWGTRDKVYHLSREAENAFTQSNGKVELLDLGHHFPISHPKLTAEALTSLRNRQ
jgi:pimeloyl-ACP methyl ester carboxylesterase